MPYPYASDDTARRFETATSPVVAQSDDGRSTMTEDGFIWVDADGDGDKDFLFWENPHDNDGDIDAFWDEIYDKWVYNPTEHFGYIVPVSVYG